MSQEITSDCQCSEHEGKRSFFCKRHGCKKHAAWLGLCQTRPEYFQAWEEGRGPGQISTTTPVGPRLTPLEQIKKTFRDYVTSRPLARGMTFSQALLSLSARPWAAILQTLTLCAECENLSNNRCIMYDSADSRCGEANKSRRRWVIDIILRPCEEEES